MASRVLVIDDDPSICVVLQTELTSSGYVVRTECSPQSALLLLATDDFDVILTDITMAGMNGVVLCERIRQLRENTPVIVMTAFATTEVTIQSIRAGAFDFVTKPLDMASLGVALERAVDHRALEQEVTRLRRKVAERPFDEIVGKSPAMTRVFDLVSRVADADATVLITGESGTGKEVVAKAIHARSGRAKGPFIAINCAAMPENLLESELFGYVKGAFTDARGARAGLFVTASGGTLFLDEVGEMPLGMQSKLLRAIQQRTVRAVGSDVETPFDTRIIAATSRNMENEVAERRFREDLYYRLNVVHVELPPLRERGNDVLLLANHFLRRAGRARHVEEVSDAAAAKLLAYSWPGNVRELQNCVERAVALARTDKIEVEDLSERIVAFKQPVTSRATLEATATATTVAAERLRPMAEIEERYIRTVLDALGGNKAHAARVLRLDRRTLYRKLERWGDQPSADDPMDDALAGE